MNHIFAPPISTSNLYTPEFDRVQSILESAFDRQGNLVAGTLVSKLEKKLCDYHDSPHCVVFSTGFWALVAAVRLRAIPAPNEVIIPSLTYRRLADVVYWAGKTPRLVDIEPNNLSICPTAIKNALSAKTALILAVHPIVNCCDVRQILELSECSQIPVIFDAVESVHETIDAKRIGSFGVGEVFSFHASKFINGIEGGYVCTDDADFKANLERFRSGSMRLSEQSVLGLNATMNDGHAAFAIAGLEEIEKNVQHNKQIYEAYLKKLAPISGIDVVEFDETQQSSYKNVVAEISGTYPIDRDQLVSHLNSMGILARAYYAPGLHAKPYQYSVEIAEMPTTHKSVGRFINLPCGSRVTESDIAKTCNIINEIRTNEKDARSC